MSHSPEPWKTFPYAGPVPAFRMHSVTTTDGEFILAVGGPDNETAIDNLNRIVACVSACRGIPTPVLAAEEPGGGFNVLLATLLQHVAISDDIGIQNSAKNLQNFWDKHQPCSPAEPS